MTTIVQYVPKWLRARLQKPTPQSATNINKKKRQLLPTLPGNRGLVILSQDDRSAGHRLLWRL